MVSHMVCSGCGVPAVREPDKAGYQPCGTPGCMSDYVMPWTQDTEHATSNAKGHLSTIVLLTSALEAALGNEWSYFDQATRDDLDSNGVPVGDFFDDAFVAQFPDLEDDVAVADFDEGFDSEDLANAIRETMENSALAVSVRSDWYSPGREEFADAVEYQVLLTTGGPALRIVGPLGLHDEPTAARLEYQDWGIPWTRYVMEGSEYDALLSYAATFYFGG